MRLKMIHSQCYNADTDVPPTSSHECAGTSTFSLFPSNLFYGSKVVLEPPGRSKRRPQLGPSDPITLLVWLRFRISEHYRRRTIPKERVERPGGGLNLWIGMDEQKSKRVTLRYSPKLSRYCRRRTISHVHCFSRVFLFNEVALEQGPRVSLVLADCVKTP